MEKKRKDEANASTRESDRSDSGWSHVFHIQRLRYRYSVSAQARYILKTFWNWSLDFIKYSIPYLE